MLRMSALLPLRERIPALALEFLEQLEHRDVELLADLLEAGGIVIRLAAGFGTHAVLDALIPPSFGFAIFLYRLIPLLCRNGNDLGVRRLELTSAVLVLGPERRGMLLRTLLLLPRVRSINMLGRAVK